MPVQRNRGRYTVGVLGYEMLAGRLPFSAASPQAMLAAHVTEAPEPLSQNRQAVPPALGALVMRCLEKRPADRWQRAEELLPQLEALATPTGVAPIRSEDSDAALRLGHPIPVTLLFAVVALTGLGLVDALVAKLGLPSWVFGGAVALVVVAWPLMLATGRVERQRALARRTSMGAPPPTGLGRWLTWRTALRSGAAAFGGLAVIAAVYMGLRHLGIGPIGTLLAKGALKAREPIILSDFENRTADSSLGLTLTEAFRVDLSRSRTVQLVDGARIGDGLRRMQREPGTPLSAALARELAEREGIKAVVTGEIDPVGKGYVLVASVVSAGDGAVLTGVREAAADDAALIAALDRLSRDLRERIGESLTTIRANEPLEQVTTRSLEALQKYTQAVRSEQNGDYEAEITQLQQAIALDTGFAMAYRKLAAMVGNVGGSIDQAVAAATHAFAHRDRLPALERDQTTAFYYWTVDYQPAQAIAAYRDVLALDPNDHIALNNLALLLTRQRQWSAAESLVMRGIATGRCGSPCYENAVVAEAYQGHFTDAQETIERFTRAAPHDPLALALRASIASSRHDYATTERLLRRLRDEQQPSAPWREQTSLALAALALVQGRLALAQQHTRDAMATAERRGLKGHYIGGAIGLGAIDVWVRNRPTDGFKHVAAALARYPLESIPPVDRPYTSLARFYRLAGRPEEARRQLTDYERVVPAGLRHGDSGRHAAEGDVAVAEGRLRDALAAYQAWRDESGCGECGLFEEAHVYDRLANADSALALYERLVTVPAPFRLTNTDAFFLTITFRRLGELYEARHERARARDYYSRFLDLWKTADPELQPVVEDVRARLARLTAER